MGKINLIYIGRRDNAKNLAHVYVNTKDQNRMLFKTKLGYGAIGSITEAEEISTGVKGPYKVIALHENKEEISEWVVKDRVEYDSFQATKESSKKIITGYDNAIAQLRKAYKEQSSPNRQIFLNRLIVEITKW